MSTELPANEELRRQLEQETTIHVSAEEQLENQHTTTAPQDLTRQTETATAQRQGRLQRFVQDRQYQIQMPQREAERASYGSHFTESMSARKRTSRINSKGSALNQRQENRNRIQDAEKNADLRFATNCDIMKRMQVFDEEPQLTENMTAEEQEALREAMRIPTILKQAYALFLREAFTEHVNKNRAFQLVTENFISWQINLDLRDDKTLSENGDDVIDLLRKSEMFQELRNSCPDLFSALPEDDQALLLEKEKQVSQLADYCRTRVTLLKNDYYQTHLNSEISQESGTKLTSDPKELEQREVARLLRQSDYLRDNLDTAHASGANAGVTLPAGTSTYQQAEQAVLARDMPQNMREECRSDVRLWYPSVVQYSWQQESVDNMTATTEVPAAEYFRQIRRMVESSDPERVAAGLNSPQKVRQYRAFLREFQTAAEVSNGLQAKCWGMEERVNADFQRELSQNGLPANAENPRVLERLSWWKKRRVREIVSRRDNRLKEYYDASVQFYASCLPMLINFTQFCRENDIWLKSSYREHVQPTLSEQNVGTDVVDYQERTIAFSGMNLQVCEITENELAGLRLDALFTRGGSVREENRNALQEKTTQFNSEYHQYRILNEFHEELQAHRDMRTDRATVLYDRVRALGVRDEDPLFVDTQMRMLQIRATLNRLFVEMQGMIQ